MTDLAEYRRLIDRMVEGAETPEIDPKTMERMGLYKSITAVRLLRKRKQTVPK